MKSLHYRSGTRIKKIIPALFLPVLALVVLFSCEKEKETNYTWLAGSEKIKTYSVAQSKSQLGTLSVLYPNEQELADNARYDIEVYKLTYKTSFKGDEIIASGIVCVPTADENFPFLSFQNGTNTLLSNAPSVNLLSPLYSVLESMAAEGYILIIADYIGFGASDNLLHPYYHRESNNAAVVDLIHAAGEFINSGGVKARNDGRLFLMGYSQGGWSTLSVLDEIENNSALPLDIVAVSCGSGAYNVLEVAGYIMQLNTYPSPLYLPYFIESHIRNGLLDEPLDKYFKQPYASQIPGLFNGLNSNAQINAQLPDSIGLLLTDDFRNNLDEGPSFETLRNELIMNSVQAWHSSAKITFTYGTADDNVPPFESQNIYNDFINAGSSTDQVKIVALDTLNHDTVLIPWGIQTISWFNSLKE